MLLGHLHFSFSSPYPPVLLHFSQLKVPSSSSYRFALLLPTLPFLPPFQNQSPVSSACMHEGGRPAAEAWATYQELHHSLLLVGPPESLPHPCPVLTDLIWCGSCAGRHSYCEVHESDASVTSGRHHFTAALLDTMDYGSYNLSIPSPSLVPGPRRVVGGVPFLFLKCATFPTSEPHISLSFSLSLIHTRTLAPTHIPTFTIAMPWNGV